MNKVAPQLIGGNMAIRYDPGLNKEIRRVVNNFNRKRQRAIKRGYKDMPPRMYVSELKARYQNRGELKSELARLENFNKGGDRALATVENSGGAHAIKWEYDYLKANQQRTIDYLQREYNRLTRLDAKYPGQRQRLDAVAANLSIAQMNIDYMNQDQFKSYRAGVRTYLNSMRKNAGAYRGFMSAVETLMRYSGIPEKTINNFFDKFKVLTPDEFTYLYETNDLISLIFDTFDSYGNGEVKIYASDEETKDRINALLEETDDFIEQAKSRELEKPLGIGEELEEFNKQVRKMEGTEPDYSRKIAKSTLSKKQIAVLKELGWDDLIDETK